AELRVGAGCRHFRVRGMWSKGGGGVPQLFRSVRTEPGQLPAEIRSRALGDPPLGPGADVLSSGGADIASSSVARAVCDYLAGLTDREALQEYARLFDPSVLS